MTKQLFSIFVLVFSYFSKTQAQCPQFYDSQGNLSANPVFVYCQGGPFSLSIQSPTSFPAFAINWGDGTPLSTGLSYSAMTNINHVYKDTVATFVITLNIPLSACTQTYLVVTELPVAAGAQNFGGVTSFCAPGTITVTNLSTNVSPTTVFTWDWGDGTPIQTFNSANQGQNVIHTFAAGNVPSCQRQVTLRASNYCRPIPNPLNLFVDIYDLDNTTIGVDRVTKCFPETTFTLTNTTQRQCFAQGNTFQRQERWNLGNYWGLGRDSIINWSPWPPTSPRVVSFPGLGTYTVTLLDSNRCGVKSAARVVNVVLPPVAGMIAPSGTICQNTSVTFTNSSQPGYSYKWNFGIGAAFVDLGPGNKSIIYATPGTYSVQHVAFVNGSSAACSDTAKAVVVVVAAPVANFSLSPTSGCGSVTAVTFTNGTTGALTYTWILGNGNTFVGLTPTAQNYTNAGVSTISLLVTGATGCVHTKTSDVVVYAKPIPNFPQFANCVNAVSNFSSTSIVSGTAAISSYTWNFGDNSPKSSQQNPTHTYSLANTYTVKLIVSTPFCSDSINKTIVINLRPTANFVFTPSVNCPPFAVTFSNTTTSGVNYNWRFGTATNATSSAVSPSFAFGNSGQTIQNYTVTLVTSTGAGCADSIKKVIAVYPKPIASFTTNILAGCSPIPINFTNTSVGVNTYSWNFGNGSVSTNTNSTHIFSNTTLGFQTRTVQLSVNNNFGCKDTAFQTIQVFPESLSAFTLTPGSGCGPMAVSFSPVQGAISYTWNYGDGSPVSNAANPPHTYTNNTTSDRTFTINLGTTNAFGCIGGTSATATVFAKPVANFSFSPNNGCTPLVVTFTNTSVLNAVNSWTFGNGQTSPGTDPVTTYSIAPGEANKTFSVNLRVTSAKGCQDNLNNIVRVFALPKSQFNVDTPACSPRSLTFTNTSIGANSYTWSFGDGSPTMNTKDPTKLFINNTQFHVTYQVTLNTKSNDGCDNSITVPVVVHPKPVFFVLSAPDSGCSPLKVNFSRVVGAVKYYWNFDKTLDGAGIVTTNSISNTFVNTSGLEKNYSVQMVAEDIFGCKDTAEKTVRVFPNPIAKFTASPLSVFIPNQTTNFTNISVSGNAFSWDFGDGNKSVEKNPSHTYTKAGEYEITLKVTTNRGCMDQFTLPEKVKASDETDIQVPNAFTPNSAGSPGNQYNPKADDNDIFHPVLRGAEKYNFSIYSRWGELIFDTRDSNEGWDGYYKGKLCTQDIYIWKISATFIDGKTYNKTGDVLLLR